MANKKNKERSKKGPNYKSNLERSIAAFLTKRKVDFDYEKITLPFTQPAKERKYKPDFRIKANSLVIEAKGYLTFEDRCKLLWVKEQHPEVNLVLLFQNASKTINNRAKKKTTYGEWCDKHGFEWADFRNGIPETWISKK